MALELIQEGIGFIGKIFGKDESLYDVKKKATEDKIRAEVLMSLPDPMNVLHAETLVQEAMRLIAIAQGKDQTASNKTYAQMYRERLQFYQQYIASGGKMSVATLGSWIVGGSVVKPRNPLMVVVFVLAGLGVIIGAIFLIKKRRR